jgi:hypothetical protein
MKNQQLRIYECHRVTAQLQLNKYYYYYYYVQSHMIILQQNVSDNPMTIIIVTHYNNRISTQIVIQRSTYIKTTYSYT